MRLTNSSVIRLDALEQWSLTGRSRDNFDGPRKNVNIIYSFILITFQPVFV